MWKDIKYEILSIVICVGLVFLLMIGVNSCSFAEWNDGECSDCEVRYEFRGVSKGLKYYVCPECGREVERY